ncbi:hypothetical protein [Streptomyces sp. NBC_01506]|uniref:hypothetical protein n=1 Tax=Streptomyces sp. NBC_01506 TaxID=2903887 RepID=UPI00386C5D2C
MSTYATSEQSTWIQGQTSIPGLKELIKGTTFLDWSRPGITQTVQMKNELTQNIYVLERTRILFILADMATSSASLATAATVKGMMVEAVVRALVGLKDWKASMDKYVQDTIAVYNTNKIELDKYAAIMAKKIFEAGISLNGDAKTLYDSVIDLFGRVDADNVHSELGGGQMNKDDPFTKELIKRFRLQGKKIVPGATKPVRQANLVEGLAVFTGTNQPPAELKEAAANALQAINISGVSGVAGQLGIPTVDMYVMTHNAVKFAHMTTAPNISWVVKPDKIVPADNLGAEITELPGLGYYLWSNAKDGKDFILLQNKNRVAYNALASAGFDRAGATVILREIFNTLNGRRLAEGTPKDEIAATAAEIATGANFRKLLWMVYKRQGNSPEAIKNSVNRAIDHIDWNAGTKTSLILYRDSASAEKYAKERVVAKDFSEWSVKNSDAYDACLSAGRYGINFNDTVEYLFRLSVKFHTSTWSLAAPTGGGLVTSDYVGIIAALHGFNGGDKQKVLDQIDKLGAYYVDDTWKAGQAGDNQKLLAWWDTGDALPDMSAVTVKPVGSDWEKIQLETQIKLDGD